MNLKLLAVIVAAVIGVIGIGVLSSDPETTTTSSNLTTNTYGESPLSLKVIEVADFECPACAQFYPITDEVKEQYKDQVEFEFIHFPLTAIHPNAFAAHRAAQAAANQGKFWEMHDLLFEQRSQWISQTTNEPVEVFNGFAEQLGLDVELFKTNFASQDVNDFIRDDLARGRELGAEATPTFIIDGEIIPNSELASVESFSAVLDEKLAALEASQE